MANGFIRQKKVQWVFDNKYDLNAFIPKVEGVYALDNSTGDIYIWNSKQWVLYYQYAVMVPAREPKIQAHYRNWAQPPDITASLRIVGSASGSGYSSASLLSFIITDVDVMRGNYLYGTNDSGFYDIQFITNDVDPIAPLGNYVLWSGSLTLSGSFIYNNISHSIV